MDIYWNFMYKIVMGYRWLSEYCLYVDFVFYKDDDFKINCRNIMYKLKFLKNLDFFFVGFFVKNGKGIYCDLKYKWYLLKKDYLKDIFLLYFLGGVYIVSIVIVKKLVFNFYLVKWILIDDVYIGFVV